MAYSESLYQPSVLELARSGNIRAIAYWLNSFLVPQGLHASVGMTRSGYLQVIIEFQRVPERDRLVRFVCHRLCKLNSKFVKRVRIVARFAGETQALWKQSVHLVTPANRQKKVLRQPHSQASLRQLLDQRTYLKLARSLLLTGSAVAAFVLGCLLSYNETPTEPIMASASEQAETVALVETAPARPNTVDAALETVPVIQHDEVLNPADPAVTLMFAGDVTLSDAFEDMVGTDHDWAFAALDEYRNVDVAMVNLENPLTQAETPLPDKQFNFKAAPEAVEVLTQGGVDIVTLANNHAMDYQADGLEETINVLDRAGIQHIGAGRDIQEARRPDIIEVKGQRIAYLGYYDADLHAAEGAAAGTNPVNNARIAEDIRAIRDQVDWIVVNYHWGEELAEYPGDWQIDLAHFTIDQGADLVVGHHPHVLQGAEIYKGRPIAYSLGNFIFGGNSRSEYDTAVLKVSLRDQQMKVEFVPIEVVQYQPRVATGDRASEIMQQLEERSSIFGQPMRSSVILDTRSSTVTEPSTPAEPTTDSFTDDSFTEPLVAPSEDSSTEPDDSSTGPLETPTNNFDDSFTEPSVDPGSDSLTEPSVAPPDNSDDSFSEPFVAPEDESWDEPSNLSDPATESPGLAPTEPQTPEMTAPPSDSPDSFITYPESSPAPEASPEQTAPENTWPPLDSRPLSNPNPDPWAIPENEERSPLTEPTSPSPEGELDAPTPDSFTSPSEDLEPAPAPAFPAPPDAESPSERRLSQKRIAWSDQPPDQTDWVTVAEAQSEHMAPTHTMPTESEATAAEEPPTSQLLVH